MREVAIVFIHGVGKAQPNEKWFQPLLHSLAGLGLPMPERHIDRVVEPDYVAQMRLRAQTEMPPVTWRAPDDKSYESARLAFAVEAERVAHSVLGRQGGPDAGWAQVPSWLGDIVENVATRTVMGEVGNYKKDGRTRASAVHAVLRSVPKDGPVIMIGYSLGSVIAIDLLRRISEGATVELLLTVGSPLGLNGYGDRGALNDKFPYDRVRRWVNVYDPSDPATGGRGARKRYSDALDVPVTCNWSHDVTSYMSHHATALAVGTALRSVFDDSPPDPGTEIVPPTDVARQQSMWAPALLQHAYLLAVSAEFQPNDWRKKDRFEHARVVVARRMADQVAEAVSSGLADSASRVTEEDLARHATRLVHGVADLDLLVPYLVSYADDVPLSPFDVELSQAHTQRALERFATAVLVGRLRHNRSEIAKLVAQAAKTGREAVARGGGNNGWVVVLGTAVLAATGVGLAAAVPAGLAGAAAVTATLAAFGPGGMVGGVAAIAALTGSGTALIAGGAASSRGGGPSANDRAIARAAAETLWTQPTEVIRSTLAAIIGVLEAQRLLHLDVAVGQVINLVSDGLARASDELKLHRRLSPDGPATNELQSKVALFDKALTWLLDPDRKWPTASPAELEAPH